MAHLEGEAAVAGANDAADAAAGADNGQAANDAAEQGDEPNLYPDDLPVGDSEPQGNDNDAGGEAGEAGENDDDDEGDPLHPAPDSLNAEERAKYATLPPEAQEFFSSTLQRREVETRQGIAKLRETHEAQIRQATDTVAQTQQGYARQFDALVNAFAPQPPPTELARTNPSQYMYEKARYDEESGTFQQLVQQVKSIETEASQHYETQQAQWKEQRSKTLMSDPEFAQAADPGEYLRPIIDFGVKELGYDENGLGENAEAQDILNIRRAMRWKADADKWANHQRKRNQRPREAKTGQFQAAPVGRVAANGAAQADPLRNLYPND